MSVWRQNSKCFEESMIEEVIEGMEYRMKLEGLDTAVLKELKEVFVL